ncbi:MAG: restriction endonuclease subunit S [Rhodospirillaceae bacterium]|nr:restriction endonuclease subunit S [Rhodospirillaceae bacterium]
MNISDGIGKLPDGWKAKPLRSVADYIVSNVDKVISESEIPIRLCNYTDVYHNEFITLGLDFMRATASEDEISKFHLAVNDVVITKDSESWDDIGAPALVQETADDLVCGYHLALLRPRKQVMDGSFLLRCFQAKPVRFQLELSARGITRFGLSKSEIGAIRLPVPPLQQQRAIANYLNQETARLDALVVAKVRVLELLVEKRQALIATAVTRGLASTGYLVPPEGGDGTARERENGSIESERSDQKSVAGGSWVSGYDENDRRRLKYAATVNDDVLGEDTKHDYELQYIDIGNVYSSGSVEEPETYQFKDAPSRARRRVREGDIIISCVRTYLQAIAQIRNPPANLVVSTGFAVIRPSVDFLDPKYASYALREPSFLAEIEKRSVGVSYPAINPSELADISIHLPPIREQRSIAYHLDRETERLNALTAEVENTVALLEERRAALIAEAVIGRIDVECAA